MKQAHRESAQRLHMTHDEGARNDWKLYVCPD